MRKLILTVLLGATAFAGQAYGQAADRTPTVEQTAYAIADLTIYDRNCPGADHVAIARLIKDATSKFLGNTSNEELEKVIARMTGHAEKYGMGNWCADEKPIMSDLPHR
jgi:hypothetical protein